MDGSHKVTPADEEGRREVSGRIYYDPPSCVFPYDGNGVVSPSFFCRPCFYNEQRGNLTAGGWDTPPPQPWGDSQGTGKEALDTSRLGAVH